MPRFDPTRYRFSPRYVYFRRHPKAPPLPPPPKHHSQPPLIVQLFWTAFVDVWSLHADPNYHISWSSAWLFALLFTAFPHLMGQEQSQPSADAPDTPAVRITPVTDDGEDVKVHIRHMGPGEFGDRKRRGKQARRQAERKAIVNELGHTGFHRDPAPPLPSPPPRGTKQESPDGDAADVAAAGAPVFNVVPIDYEAAAAEYLRHHRAPADQDARDRQRAEDEIAEFRRAHYAQLERDQKKKEEEKEQKKKKLQEFADALARQRQEEMEKEPEPKEEEKFPRTNQFADFKFSMAGPKFSESSFYTPKDAPTSKQKKEHTPSTDGIKDPKSSTTSTKEHITSAESIKKPTTSTAAGKKRSMNSALIPENRARHKRPNQQTAPPAKNSRPTSRGKKPKEEECPVPIKQGSPEDTTPGPPPVSHTTNESITIKKRARSEVDDQDELYAPPPKVKVLNPSRPSGPPSIPRAVQPVYRPDITDEERKARDEKMRAIAMESMQAIMAERRRKAAEEKAAMNPVSPLPNLLHALSVEFMSLVMGFLTEPVGVLSLMLPRGVRTGMFHTVSADRSPHR